MDLGSPLGGDVDLDIALVRCCALTGGGTISVIVAPVLLRRPVLFETPFFSRSVCGLVSLGPVLTPLVTLRFFTLVPRRVACTRYFKPANPRVWPALTGSLTFSLPPLTGSTQRYVGAAVVENRRATAEDRPAFLGADHLPDSASARSMAAEVQRSDRQVDHASACWEDRVRGERLDRGAASLAGWRTCAPFLSSNLRCRRPHSRCRR